MSLYAEQIEFLQAGNSLWALATVDFYQANTTTRVDVYSDRAKASTVANPYTLNSLGRPSTPLYADGLIKIVITPVSGTAVTFDYQSHGLVAGPWIDGSGYATLNAAITAIGSTVSTLLINSSLAMNANATIPATCAVHIQKTGKIDCAGYDLTINGQFSAGAYNVFDITTSGSSVAFGAAAVAEVLPEWWTDNATPGTTNMTTALAAAYATNKPIKLGQTTYLFSTLPIDTNPIVMTGDGYETSILQTTAAANVAIPIADVASVEGSSLKRLWLKGNATNLGGISLGDDTHYTAWTLLDEVKISGFTNAGAGLGYGVKMRSVQELHIHNCKIMGNHINVYRANEGFCTSALIDGKRSYIGSATDQGVYLNGTVSDLTIRDVIIEGNANEGVLCSDYASNLNIQDCYFEGNSTGGTGTVSVTGNSTPYNSTKLTFTGNKMHINVTNTIPQLNLDYVIAYVANNSGLLADGGIDTTTDTVAHFEMNKESDAAAWEQLYRAMAGQISANDIDENLRPFTMGRSWEGPLYAIGGAPSIAVAAAAGTSATATLTAGATDFRGQVNLTTGSGSYSAGAQCTVTFAKAFAAAPLVYIMPGNAISAAAFKDRSGVFATVTTTTFTIDFGAAAAGAVAYVFNYLVIG